MNGGFNSLARQCADFVLPGSGIYTYIHIFRCRKGVSFYIDRRHGETHIGQKFATIAGNSRQTGDNRRSCFAGRA